MRILRDRRWRLAVMKSSQVVISSNSKKVASTLEISGNTGVQTLSFTSGTHSSAIAYAVNSISDSTGVTAQMITPGNITSGITFSSTGYGSKNFVSVGLAPG